MAAIKIEKGLDIELAGEPSKDLTQVSQASEITIYPHHIKRIKARTAVEQGDSVKIGTPLFFDKTQPDLQFCSPAAGTVKEIVLGERRSLHAIKIDQSGTEAESFNSYTAETLARTDRETLLKSLMNTGLIALLQERPFGKIPNPENEPKSIFINAMNTAPFQPDPQVLAQGREEAFFIGCAALKRMTKGRIHLNVGVKDIDLLPSIPGVDQHIFGGPHPSGNTSTHIYHLDPMAPQDIIWTVTLEKLLLLGEFLASGKYPAQKTICVGSPAADEADRKHYRVQIGTPFSHFLNGTMNDAAQKRFIRGDVLSGTTAQADESVGFFEESLNVLTETDDRLFMGWILPGKDRYSHSPSYLSKWLGEKKKWSLNTLLNGSKRSLVLTGRYEEVVPMAMMVDFLVKAILAHDTDEAIELGILETLPEDFALCSFICPSKLDISQIIQQGLDEVEEEGV